MENTTQPQTLQITVADLDALRAIVDLASQRGAFRGVELSQVGAVYDKLTAFLTSVLEQAKADAEAQAATTETTETTTGDSQGE